MGNIVLVLAVSAALTAGCAVEDPLDVDSTQSEVTTDNRIATNRIATNKLALTRLSAVSLVASDLDGSLEAIAATEDGREVLSYAIGCALPPGESVWVTSNGIPYGFFGTVGVAPRWREAPLSTADRNAVSACLFARSNAFGISVALSMRGPYQALSPSPLEVSQYQTNEGAFWGDVFTGDSPMIAYACTGKDQVRDDSFGTLPLRVCASPEEPCGIEVVGNCEDVCSGKGAFYSGCPNGGTNPITVRLFGVPAYATVGELKLSVSSTAL